MRISIYYFFILFSPFTSLAQPQVINYQGVARNSQGLPLVNNNISLRLSILDSSVTGQAVYVETQNATTSGSGLFNIGIGLGTVVSGTFSSISWGQGDKWLKTEMDTAGGNNFQLIGTTQFLSVPFALYAGSISKTYSLGLNPELGGYVFYISPDGMHGLVAATQDQGGAYWGRAQDIVSYVGNHNLIGMKFTDWRVPTQNELNLMYIAKTFIGGFSNSFYWSSSEDTPNYAVGQNFSNGSQGALQKQNTGAVRAVRTF